MSDEPIEDDDEEIPDEHITDPLTGDEWMPPESLEEVFDD